MTVCVARAGLESQIQEILESSLQAMGYCLVRVRYQFLPPPPLSKKDRRLKRKKPESSGRLQLMFERTDGNIFGIKDCSKASRQVSSLLDVADPIDHPFQLEVSSVGILRPLTRNSDFTNYTGHRVEITLGQILDGRRRFKGTLQRVNDEKIHVVQEETEGVDIPLSLIAEARLLMSPELEQKIQNIDNA